MKLFVGPLILIVFVLIELLLIRFWKKETIPWTEISLNLNSGQILLWVFRGFEVLGYFYVVKYLSLDLLASWPAWLIWLFGFIAWDHQFYWMHRIHHKIPFLWYIHEVHHQGEHYNLSLGIRNSWFSSLSSFPFYIPLAIIGLPTEIFLAVSSINYIIQFYNHTDLVKKTPILEWVFVTPDLHKVHHAVNRVYRDKNCGGTLNIWDRLYGTFQKQLPEEPLVLGLNNSYKTGNPFWANMIPFLRSKVKPQRKISNLPFLHLATFMLFFELLFYVYLEATLMFEVKAILFGLVFLGTIAIGGVHEGRTWGVYGWMLICIAWTLMVFTYPSLQIEGIVYYLVLKWIYSLILLFRYFWFKAPTDL